MDEDLSLSLRGGADLYGIPAKFLRYCDDAMVKPLYLLLNMSITMEMFSTVCKKSLVRSIDKSNIRESLESNLIDIEAT